MILLFLKPHYAPLRAEKPQRVKSKKAKRKYFNRELIAFREWQRKEKESILALILNWFIDDEE